MSKMNSLYVSLLALVAALVALGMCIHCCAQKQSLSVEETLNNNPEIIINAMQNYEQKMREQAAAEAANKAKAEAEKKAAAPAASAVNTAKEQEILAAVIAAVTEDLGPSASRMQITSINKI